MIIDRKRVLVVGLLFVVLLAISFSSAVLDKTGNVSKSGVFTPVVGSGNLGNPDVLLNSEISLSSGLDDFAKMFFGFNRSTAIDLQTFIILIAMTLVVFLLLHSVLLLVPFLSGGIMTWIASLIIVALMSITGGIRIGCQYLFDIASLFGILDKWPTVRLIIGLFIIVAIFIGGSKIAKIFRENIRVAQAEQTGRDIAEGADSARILSEAKRKLAQSD